MNLRNLKPAWRQFQLSNSLQRMSHEEIFLILESVEVKTINKVGRFLLHSFQFMALTICCQGG
jgi:hypothetical protein